MFYQGELTYLSLEATSGSSGVSTFAATITITPLEGQAFDLSSGVTVYYSIDTSGTESSGEDASGETVLAPIDALCTYEDGYYLLIEADSRPDNTIDPEKVGRQRHRLPQGLLRRACGGRGLQRPVRPDPLRRGGGRHRVPPLPEHGALRRRHHLSG